MVHPGEGRIHSCWVALGPTQSLVAAVIAGGQGVVRSSRPVVPVSSGSEDPALRLLRPGAQRASLSSRLSLVLAASLFASLFAFGASAAAPPGVSAATPPWYAVETYYLRLLNCTRTGGWVLKDGSCKGYGSGNYSSYVAPLKRSAGLSDGRTLLGEEDRDRRCLPPRRSQRAPAQRGLPGNLVGREHRLLGPGERLQVRAGQPPLLPGREGDQRRPLEEHQERPVHVRRHRRVEGERPHPPRDRLLPAVAPPPTLARPAAAGQCARRPLHVPRRNMAHAHRPLRSTRARWSDRRQVRLGPQVRPG